MEKSNLIEDLRHLVLHVVEEVVDHDEPGDIDVDVLDGDHYMTVELRTNPSDVGQVVGHGGTVISSLRTILNAFGGKRRMQINLVYVTERQNAQARMRRE